MTEVYENSWKKYTNGEDYTYDKISDSIVVREIQMQITIRHHFSSIKLAKSLNR